MRHGQVSIHAPLGGATSWMTTSWKHWKVSIHAPLGGATAAAAKDAAVGAMFQSTRP